MYVKKRSDVATDNCTRYFLNFIKGFNIYYYSDVEYNEKMIEFSTIKKILLSP